ncbi:MAG: DUF6662 family protein [Acidobacteriota bacterium]
MLRRATKRSGHPIRLGTVAGIALAIGALDAEATERYFTYTYEPETMPQGAGELEQWVTLRAGRSTEAGAERYTRWVIREEFEYGVTDSYTAAIYLNAASTSYRDPSSREGHNEFEFAGISVENRVMVFNPTEHTVGLALYVEPSYSGEEAELEEKVIFGQRVGDWKWALNATHATEWDLFDDESEGELEFTFGLTRHLGDHWSIGFEVRNHSDFPGYDEWEHSAFFAGPVISHRRENWWAALTILPQVYGKEAQDQDSDGSGTLVLDGHERLEVRLILGI